MIPVFDESGYLPPGMHVADIDEVVERFGTGSDQREACGQSLRWLVPMCRRAGIIRLIVNGSFVTDRPEPNDVDCVLVAGPAFDKDSDAALAIEAGLPYLSLAIVETDDELRFYTEDLFATDRAGRPKGLVEVRL